MSKWLSANLRGEFKMGVGRVETTTMFGVMCWMLWKNRNNFIFQHVRSRAKEIPRAAECFTINLCDTTKNNNAAGNFRSSLTKWRPASSGWIKINMDGTANLNGSWSAVGGVLRDSVRNWIEGFQRFIGRGSSMNAELWAIFYGLEMAQSRRYDKVILETDCMTAVEMIKEGLRSTTTTNDDKENKYDATTVC
ncbi:hypothetical protein PVK06_046693 [Gossypium arboreum]|uniref:RNase H type-1 domain-containing protein n=1 Tax=Gossypium arboreum TaxID=29729 RepID=A0ABR0MD81_GOSAR|nr:hypothetical protein PVK06_046688 [Gossypium arboreum]KAK5770542.1 hypothetical protein PVK06_046693 [Gossypium arboreum]